MAQYGDRVGGPKPPALSGAELVGMVATLEAFIVALAASEAKTRPDPVEFIKKLRVDAQEAAERFKRPETLETAEKYSEELISAIITEAGIEMPKKVEDKK